MPEYIQSPITPTDVDQLEQDAYDYLQTRWPNWTPADGNIEAWLVAALARIVAEARDVASDVPASILRYFGSSVLGIAPIDSVAATVSTDWVMIDNAGYTVDAGTLVAIPDADGNVIGFEVVSTFVVAPASTTQNNVILRAIQEGAFTSGLGTAAQVLDLIDPLDFVASVTLDAASSGGQDAELDEDYLNRLSARLTLLAPRPILPRDFELLAIDVAAQNGEDVRAVALDGWDAVLATGGHERTITVVLVNDDTGLDAATLTKSAVDDYLTAQREVNFVVYVDDPDRTVIDVTFAAKCYTDAIPATVEAAAEAAVATFLSPIDWGQPAVEERKWVNKTVVRLFEVAAALEAVAGLDYVTTLTLGINGGAQTAADKNLTGPAPLPTVGAIVGTVTLP